MAGGQVGRSSPLCRGQCAVADGCRVPQARPACGPTTTTATHPSGGADPTRRATEPKGFSGTAATVELTEGDVRNACEHQPTDLFIVDSIVWRREADGSI